MNKFKINIVFSEVELDREATIVNFATVQKLLKWIICNLRPQVDMVGEGHFPIFYRARLKDLGKNGSLFLKWNWMPTKF